MISAHWPIFPLCVLDMLNLGEVWKLNSANSNLEAFPRTTQEGMSRQNDNLATKSNASSKWFRTICDIKLVRFPIIFHMIQNEIET